jgi:hypothetical protein
MRALNKNDTALFLRQIAVGLCICVCYMHPGLAQTDTSKIQTLSKPNGVSPKLENLTRSAFRQRI